MVKNERGGKVVSGDYLQLLHEIAFARPLHPFLEYNLLVMLIVGRPGFLRLSKDALKHGATLASSM